MGVDFGKGLVVDQNIGHNAVDHLVVLNNVLEQFLKVGKGGNAFFALSAVDDYHSSSPPLPRREDFTVIWYATD